VLAARWPRVCARLRDGGDAPSANHGDDSGESVPLDCVLMLGTVLERASGRGWVAGRFDAARPTAIARSRMTFAQRGHQELATVNNQPPARSAPVASAVVSASRLSERSPQRSQHASNPECRCRLCILTNRSYAPSVLGHARASERQRWESSKTFTAHGIHQPTLCPSLRRGRHHRDLREIPIHLRPFLDHRHAPATAILATGVLADQTREVRRCDQSLIPVGMTSESWDANGSSR
jgi:hypothetical protein